MAKISNEKLNSVYDDWSNDGNGLPYSGKEVRTAIQSKFQTIDTKLESLAQGDAYYSKLFCQLESNEFVTSDKLVLPLKFCGIVKVNGEESKVDYNATVRVFNNGEEVTSFILRSRGVDENKYTDIDLTEYLVNGMNDIYMIAQYEVEEKGVISSPRMSFAITKTSLEVSLIDKEEYVNSWKQVGDFYELKLGLTGVVDRKLYVDIDGSKYEFDDIPSNKYNSNRNYYTAKFKPSDKLNKHGIRTIEAYITCADGRGGTLKSNVVHLQRMVDRDTEDLGEHLLVIDLKDKLTNYVQDKLCDYIIYTKGDKTNGNVVFNITDYEENNNYYNTKVQPEVNKLYSLYATVEVENDDDNEFDVYFNAKDSENETLFEQTSILVDNKDKYAPTSGADFYLNPKTRENNEEAPETIINAINGNTITSTFTNFGGSTDRWVTDEDGVKVLRVLAGEKVEFDYDWLLPFKTNQSANVTMEIDYKVRNITNEDDVIIGAYENYGSSFIGFKMQPLYCSVFSKNNSVPEEQDLRLAEGRRTHIAVNIVKNNIVDGEFGEKTMSVCRIFVNGVINREFLYDGDEWYNKGSKFVIGQSGADIDIYGIRIYNMPLSATDVMQNYISCIPSTTDRIAFKNENKILDGGSGEITKELCNTYGKNTYIWHGKLTRHSWNGDDGTSKKKGWLELHIYDDEGNELPEYSGTICKATQSLEETSQGTTAKNYFEHNYQNKIKDVTDTIQINRNKFHKDITIIDEIYTAKSEDTGLEVGKQYVKIYGCGLGKNDWASTAERRIGGAQYYKIEGNKVTVPDGWIDGNDMYRGKCYKLSAKSPYCQKIVNKINYASSMQSHLPAANNAYNDLHTAIVGKVGLQKGLNDGSRLCKEQQPVLIFEEDKFKGLGTFGAGKMDDATFGFDKKEYPLFCMIEGSDNGSVLCNFRVPWDRKHIKYDAAEEYFTYTQMDKGKTYEQAGWDLDKFVPKGQDANGNDIPKDELIDKIAELQNYVYLHSTHIKYFVGNYGNFINSNPDTDYKYWCTSGDEAYKLKRYEPSNGEWVDAGWDGENATVYDLKTLYAEAYNTYRSKINELNEAFKLCIAKDADLDKYFYVDSLKFNYNFVVTLLAGTDNCAKNTYFTYEPDADGNYKWKCTQDDMDSILPTDNLGHMSKHYYIDRRNPYNDNDSSNCMYEGMSNGLFDLCQTKWDEMDNNGITENQKMMKNIFKAMSNIGGNVWKFFEQYFFYIQKYFPAVAYNETARIRYEYPQAIGYVSDGSRKIHPITQSNGNQLESEIEFIRKRLILFTSYAAFGEFGQMNDSATASIGISDVKDGFGIRGKQGVNQTIHFTGMKPTQYLWITAYHGDSIIRYGQRCSPYETYDFSFSVVGDTNWALNGANYFKTFGNLGVFTTYPKIGATINASRLTDLVITTDGESNFDVTSLRLNTPLLERINLKGSTKILSNNLDLSNCVRLQYINIEDTGISKVTYPKNNLLSEIHLGDKITELRLVNLNSLKTFSIQGYENIEKVYIYNVNNSEQYAYNIYKYSKNLVSADFIGINWTNSDVQMLKWYSEKNTRFEGRINLVSKISYDEKVSLANRFGNIDDNTNSVYIEYPYQPMMINSIDGEDELKVGNYTYNVNATGNNFVIKDNKPSITWNLETNLYATIKDNVITVNSLDENYNDFTLTVNIETLSGSITKAKTIKFTDKTFILHFVTNSGVYEYSINNETKYTEDGTIEYLYRDNKDFDYNFSEDMLKTGIKFIYDVPHIQPLNNNNLNGSLEIYKTTTTLVKGNSMNNLLRGYLSKLKVVEGLENLDTSKVIYMKDLFSYARSLSSYLDLKNWNVKNVIELSFAYSACQYITIDCSGWEVHPNLHIQNMLFADSNIGKFNANDWKGVNKWITLETFACNTSTLEFYFDNWNIANVKSMKNSFNNDQALTTLSMRNWNFISCTDFTNCFYKCNNLINIIGPIYGISANIDLQYSTKLSKDSLDVIINALQRVKEPKTITLSQQSVNLLSEQDKETITNNNWTLITI